LSDPIIRAALSHWDLGGAPVALIAARENRVFRVDTATGAAALRLHRVGYRSITEINSELLWMDMLAKNGITVPSPIQAPDGSLLYNDGDVVVSLLSWVDGTPLSKTVVSKKGYFEIGKLLARMHTLADAWEPPSGFHRPTWDLLGDEPSWDKFWENPILDAEQRLRFIEFRCRAQQALKALHSSDYGLIHADLVPDNILCNGKELQLIDFDDGGFGYRLFDLATMTHRSRRDDPAGGLADAAINGYRTSNAVDSRALVLFEAIRACSYVGWNISRMHEPHGKQRNARHIKEAEKAIRAYNEL